jgi:hypothetical protein
MYRSWYENRDGGAGRAREGFMFLNYMKDRLWEIIFCSVMTGALALCMFQGFNLDEYAISDGLLPTVLLAGVLTVVLAMCGYNRRSIVAGALGLAGVAGLFLLYLNAREIDIVDELDSPTVIYIYPIVLFLTGVIVWLLGRTRPGTAVLFIAGTWIIIGLEYLEFEQKLPAFVLFLVCCAGQYVQLNYRCNARKSVQYTPAFLKNGAETTVMSAAAVGMAALLVLFLIIPLNLPVKDLTLLTRHIAIERLQVAGIVDTYPQEDPNQTTNETNNDNPEKTAEDENSDTNSTENPQIQQEENNNGGTNDSAGNGEDREAGAIRYNSEILWWLVIPLLVLLIIAAIILLKLLQRRRWYRRVLEQGERDQVETLYVELLRRFGVLGVRRRPEDSPLAFVKKNRRRLNGFFRNHVSLEELTSIYMKVRYGGFEPGERECRKFRTVYENFYKNCRGMTGNVRYLRYFLFL